MRDNPIFLIVDDSQAMRLVLKNVIRSNLRNCSIVESENGIDAVKKFKSLKPDLVILDMNMPQANGVVTLNAMMEINPKARIIIVSVEPLEKLPEDVIKLGAIDYITKPFDRNVIAPKIIRALK